MQNGPKSGDMFSPIRMNDWAEQVRNGPEPLFLQAVWDLKQKSSYCRPLLRYAQLGRLTDHYRYALVIERHAVGVF